MGMNIPPCSIRIEQGVIFIPIAVRPAVDGDRLNVFRRGKPASAKDTRELVSRPAFEIFKRGHQELHAPGFVLFAGWKPRLARSEERRVGKECRSRWSP